MELGCRIGKVIGQKPLPRFDVFNVRVLVGLDKLFRKKRRYQRDLSASINDTLLAVNLNTVKLVTVEGKKKQTARETQVVILRRLIRRIQKSQRRWLLEESARQQWAVGLLLEGAGRKGRRFGENGARSGRANLRHRGAAAVNGDSWESHRVAGRSTRVAEKAGFERY